MKKSKKAFLTTLSYLALLGIGMTTLVGCGESKPTPSSEQDVIMCDITWVVPDHATVVVDDYQGLPDKVPEDTAISFSVTTESGYSVDSVTANGRRVSLKNDKYTVGVTRSTEIAIQVIQSLKELKIVSKPTKLTYIAGEALDVTGMVVEATLGTGEKITVPYGGDDGYTVYPTVFEGGEENFEVTYNKVTTVVPLDAVVEFLVKLDANGGQYSSAYLSSLQAMNLHNFNHNNGVITFTYYNNLTTAVPMPKKDDVTRENYSLMGWSFEGASISNSTKANVDAKASWQIELVEISSVSLEKEGEVPYLIIEGTFRAATEVYLYLYEGNAHVELKGDTYTGSSGQPFEVKFDLRRLSEKGASYEGKWMDIRFNASVGDNVQSMEIFVNATSSVQVDTGQKILAGSYAYIFATYDQRLKVYFKEATFAYEVMGHAVTEGGVTKDYLRFSGHTNDSAHAGKYIVISCWNDSTETEGYGATIDNEGNFVVEYALEEFSSIIEKNIFFHVTIYSDNTKTDVVYGGITTNVAVADVFTPMPALASNLGDIHHAFLYTGSDGLKYYIGYAWDGLMLYVMQ